MKFSARKAFLVTTLFLLPFSLLFLALSLFAHNPGATFDSLLITISILLFAFIAYKHSVQNT